MYMCKLYIILVPICHPRRSRTHVDNIIEVIKNGGTDDEITSLAEKMTEKMFVRAEIKLAKVALYSCQTKVSHDSCLKNINNVFEVNDHM